MSRRVTVSVKTSGVENCLKKLGVAEKQIKAAAMETTEKVADIMCDSANRGFAKAKYAGTNDAFAYKTRNQYVYWVQAGGNAAPFIEFGTGQYQGGGGNVGQGPKAPGVGNVNGNMIRNSEIAKRYGPYELGDYGKGLGKNDVWVYKGVPGNNGWIPSKGRKNPEVGYAMTHGNMPQGPMFYAARTARNKAKKIAQEVFGAYFKNL